MLLAFDVGNTNTVIGLFDGEDLVHCWRVSSDAAKTVDEYGMLCHQLFAYHCCDPKVVKRVIISSVVPNLTTILVQMSEVYLNIEPFVVGAGMKTGLPIRYENPKELGADRIVNAVAGVYHYGKPLIIVDFGTATTFCAIDASGNYLGGAITAGIGISMEALFENAAKLPKVALEAPKRVIGRTTVEAMQSGLVYGYAGLVDQMIYKVSKEMKFKADQITVVATGGRSDIICPHCRYVNIIDPLLTLKGLYILAQRNADEGGNRA